jgi:hypothetical protein
VTGADLVLSIERAAALLGGELADGPLPRWLWVSRFGADFLGEAASRARTHEVALPGDGHRFLARRVRAGGIPLLAIDPDEAGADDLAEALPVLIAGQLGMRGVILTLSGLALAGFGAPPEIVVVRDWIRIGGNDPLRRLAPARIGARFPEMRALDRDAACAAARGVLAARGFPRAVVAIARQGPSGATDAELEAWRRIGGEIVVESTAGEVVAARHMGLSCAALALVPDSVDSAPAADPQRIALAAAALLPRLADLLGELARRLDTEDDGAESGA